MAALAEKTAAPTEDKDETLNLASITEGKNDSGIPKVSI